MSASIVTFNVLGVNISAVNLPSAALWIERLIQEQQTSYICVAPVSTIIAAYDDPKYQQVVNGAAMVTPDGMPLVWFAHRKGYRAVSRTYGPDLMRYICDHGRANHYRHYLYGGNEETNRKLAETLMRDYPEIQIVGREAPSFRDFSEEEVTEALRRINNAQADILWVALGSPKQDFWMAQNRGRLNIPVLIGVGAAFDFLAGTKPQAPRWMQKSGLEWLFRFCCEPRRLWRRYLIGNIRFVYLLICELISVKAMGKR